MANPAETPPSQHIDARIAQLGDRRGEALACGRALGKGRRLIPVDAFYEFTAPADPRARRKGTWAVRLAGHAWFCIVELTRPLPAGRLTVEPAR